MNAHLSSFVFANKIKRRVKTKTPTTPSCCGLGLQSRICCQNRWWAFTPPFHLCRKLALTAVCFLLHFPLGRPSHLLDEIPVFCSSDFPLRLRSEHLLCFGAIIHKNFYKFSHFHQILKHFLLEFALKFTKFYKKDKQCQIQQNLFFCVKFLRTPKHFLSPFHLIHFLPNSALLLLKFVAK